MTGAGNWTWPIVAGTYGGLAGPLRERARETVDAHLVKLERERRAERCGESWTMIE